jgi:prepilin-type N-terminal cleavage/methylation domain-containing protein
MEILCVRWRERGFSLLEAIVAIVVLSLAVPAMVWALRMAHGARVDPVLASKARWLASEKLEDVIADRSSTTRGYTYVIAANYPAESPVPGFTGFTRSVAITETGPDLASAGTGYKRVVVTVGYTGAGGAARTLMLSTVVTEYTP